MTIQVTEPSTRTRRVSRSSAAVLLGLFSVFALSLGTDQVLHVREVYPPWGQPMYETRLNLLALSYRIIYGIAGGYISARFAPRNPMRHAVVLGVVGLILSGAGAIVAITTMDLGPAWYPIVLALTAVPCAWLGGALQGMWHAEG
jgi:hypothetical protein